MKVAVYRDPHGELRHYEDGHGNNFMPQHFELVGYLNGYPIEKLKKVVTKEGKQIRDHIYYDGIVATDHDATFKVHPNATNIRCLYDIEE